MIAKPAVGHLLRRYRSRTETFVGAQIASLDRYRPLILCQQQTEVGYEPGVPLRAATAQLAGPALWLERLAYALSRRLTSAAADALAESARQERVRVLHAHYLVDARYFLGLMRRLSVPTVVSAYGYDVSSFPRRLNGLGRRYLQPVWRNVDLVLAMSEDMLRDLAGLGCPPELVRVHYHGIPVARFICPQRRYIQRELLNVLCCGTLEIKKGQHLVLEALHRLERSGGQLPRFHVTLVGDGPLRPRLEQMVRDFGWQERVTFAGHVAHHEPRLVAEYHDADIFALPSMTVRSDKEGIPGTIAEAMAAGLPVLSSRHAGIPELVEDGQSGLLVDEADVDTLAASFARLLREPALRERLGVAGLARVRLVGDLPKQTRTLEGIYDEVLHLPSARIEPKAEHVRH